MSLLMLSNYTKKAGAMLGDVFLHQLPHPFGGEHSNEHDTDHSHHSHAHSLKDLSVRLSILGIAFFLVVVSCPISRSRLYLRKKWLLLKLPLQQLGPVFPPPPFLLFVRLLLPFSFKTMPGRGRGAACMSLMSLTRNGVKNKRSLFSCIGKEK